MTSKTSYETAAANGQDADEAWKTLLNLAELSEDHEDAKRLHGRLCELVQSVKVRDSLLCRIALSEGSVGLLVARISRAIEYANEAQLPRVAGMVAALKAAYDYPVKEVKQALTKAGDDSLAVLVRRGITSKVPSSLYRRIFTDAAEKLAIAS